jgi:N-acetylneuraminic acid mutarotase
MITLGSQTPGKRYGHCMTVHNKEIYIFGGASEYIPALKIRITLGDMWKYSIEENMWKEIEISALRAEKRMFSASCCADDMWCIHGGYNGTIQNIYSDLITYDLSTFIVQYN